jgi:lipopolysaccharide transport system ATP-binding protein
LWGTFRSAPDEDEFWAVRNMTFDVKRGEVLGVIGRNGAGKSTLLKILSRIVEPSEGAVDIYGRVGSLLEVGTGFHPELTGRENVFLSGAMLGMRRHEVRGHFDEIVAFAGVEQFVDQPVKQFSSGMYARLAFAVAAHLDTEILLLDEVLAVGDAEFQRRCLGKVGEVAHSGRTVLLVSHNLAAIRQICSKSLWLDSGKLRGPGETGEITAGYLREGGGPTTARIAIDESAPVQLTEARLLDAEGRPAAEFCVGDSVGIEFRLKVAASELGRRVKLAVTLRTSDGIPLAHMVDVDSGFTLDRLHQDQWMRITLEDVRFYPGSYCVSLWVGGTDSIDEYAVWDDALTFTIVGGGGRTARRLPRSAGLVFLTPRWEVRR